MRTIAVAVDMATQVFSASELDAGGTVRQRRDFRREAFAT